MQLKQALMKAGYRAHDVNKKEQRKLNPKTGRPRPQEIEDLDAKVGCDAQVTAEFSQLWDEV